MDVSETIKLQKNWGNKPCNHPHFESETYGRISQSVGGMYVGKTGDYVCTQCGECFTYEEVQDIKKKRALEMNNKNGFHIIALFFMMLSCCAYAANDEYTAYTAQINGVYYNFSGNEATVTYQKYVKYQTYTYYRSDYSGDVVIPNTVTYNGKVYPVTTIVAHAFEDCKELNSVTVGDSVVSIGKAAFYNCTNITSVYLGNHVSNIGEHCFWGCENLKSVNIPDNVTVIENRLFISCRSLSSVVLSNNITTIKEYAFNGCNSLSELLLPSSVISIEDNAFRGCNFKSFILPEGIKTICKGTFESCSRLTEIYIGENVKSIEEKAFYGCPLVRIYNHAEFPQNCGNDVFSIVKQNCKLYVFDESRDYYSVHKDWYEFNMNSLDEALPVQSIGNGEKTTSILYDLSGRPQSNSAKSINIIHYSDGSTKKVLIK